MSLISPSRCCWCHEPLKRSSDSTPWMCWTPACWERCREWAITLEETDRKGRGTGKIAKWLFCPTPKQTEFCEQQRKTKFTLFGGAKAVAKSYILRHLAYRECMRIPGIRILLLRRTYSELEQSHLLDMPMEADRLSIVGAKYTSSDRAFSFANGSLIKAGHCETESDVSKYLSSQWDIVIFDELVTFLLDMFLAISSCARTAKPAIMAEGGAKVWGATNPGGRGASWVRELFVDHAPDPERFPSYLSVQWAYVPGRLDDNPYIEEGYRQTLMNLPPILRRQWLDGDWNAFEGQFFDFVPSSHIADLGLVA
jgi:phage terminase large subunit